jgi:hypothetical protein
VFNQLTPAETVTAIGATIRMAARRDEPASAFDRDQLMSAYSATRHLAAELAGYELPLVQFTAAVAASIRACPDPNLRGDLLSRADRVAASRDVAMLGHEIGEMLAALGCSSSDAATALQRELHGHLRSLAGREVDLLADALD